MEDNFFIPDINIPLPNDWKPNESRITVIGVGGGGCNAVNYMYNQKVKGCNYIVCNTDSQALQRCDVPNKIQMGKGLGAGTNATKGRNAAIESQDSIRRMLFGENDSEMIDMLFVTAGLGGGTGTGAAPVIAHMAKEAGVLTVAVVTIPFENEGTEAMGRAIDGINELRKNVDSLIIINNEKIKEQFGDYLVQNAFPMADQILATAASGIIEIIKKPGYQNVDFEDVRTVMKDSGLALMGCGTGSGENRIDDAINAAINSPLLNDFEISSAQKVLLNITVAKNENGLSLTDLDSISSKIRSALGKVSMFKRGIIWNEDPNADDSIYITVAATGFEYSKLSNITNVDLGSLIVVDSDFEYDKSTKISSEDGISLPVTEGNVIQTIGYNTKTNLPKFHFDERPTLAIKPGEDRSDLESIPAIRRSARKK